MATDKVYQYSRIFCSDFIVVWAITSLVSFKGFETALMRKFDKNFDDFVAKFLLVGPRGC